MELIDGILMPSIDIVADDLDEVMQVIQHFVRDYPEVSIGLYSDDQEHDRLEMVFAAGPPREEPEFLSGPDIRALMDGKSGILITDHAVIADHLGFTSSRWKLVFIQTINIRTGSAVTAVFGITNVARHELRLEADSAGLLELLITSLLQSYIGRQIHIQTLERLRDALQQVRIIKEKLLPADDYTVDGLCYAKHYQPYRSSGGDFFDFTDLRPIRSRLGYPDIGSFWGASIVDVSGHGPAAAVEAAMMDAILRTYEPTSRTGSADVLNYINRHMFTRQLRGHFITAILLNYFGHRNVVQYSSAGHPPAIILHADRKLGVSILDQATGIPLGVEREHTWLAAEAALYPGDCLILYTDGIIEAKNRQGKNFGLSGILRAVEECQVRQPEHIVRNIVDRLSNHRRHTTQMDDETILVLQPLA